MVEAFEESLLNHCTSRSYAKTKKSVVALVGKKRRGEKGVCRKETGLGEVILGRLMYPSTETCTFSGIWGVVDRR